MGICGRDEATLRRLEKQRCAAIARGDVVSLRAILAEDYRHTHASGRVDDREQLLAALEDGGPRTTARGELTVVVDGDSAVIEGPCVTVIQPFEGRSGKRISGPARQDWERRDGEWRSISFRYEEVDGVTDV
jgi:hypothetical protein